MSSQVVENQINDQIDNQVKIYSRSEVTKHNTKEDLWMIINNKVYDVTQFLSDHPGGEEVVLELAGCDATSDFDDVNHSDEANRMLEKYLIGEVDISEAKQINVEGKRNNLFSKNLSLSNIIEEYGRYVLIILGFFLITPYLLNIFT